jgi:hypothetical protein
MSSTSSTVARDPPATGLSALSLTSPTLSLSLIIGSSSKQVTTTIKPGQKADNEAGAGIINPREQDQERQRIDAEASRSIDRIVGSKRGSIDNVIAANALALL